MTEEISWLTSFSPAEAERGKFVVIDPTTITDYPSGGRGRFALITYNVGSSSGSSSSFNLPGYDYVEYGYTAVDLVSSEIYKLGGVTVATVIKGYTGTNLLSAQITL